MKIINLTLNTLLILVISGVGIFLLAPRFGLLNPFEIKIVRSGSMAPAIPTGSVVLIQPAQEYNVGEAITFGADTPTSVPTTHRIVSERIENGTTYYTTKGDANKSVDPSETPSSKVIGHIIFSLPYAGYIFAFSKTRLGFALLVLIPALLIICYELIGIAREVKAMRRRKKDERMIQTLVDEAREVHEIPVVLQEIVGDNQHLLHFDIETPYRLRRYRTL